MKRFGYLISLMIIISVLAACTPPEREVVEVPPVEKEVTRVVQVEVEKVVTATPSAKPKTLVIGMDLSTAYSLDPHTAFDSVVSYTQYQCYDRLVSMTADNWFEPAPALAESWEWSDDGLALTFHLRPGVKFASGNPLTAEDVRFTWLRHRNLGGDSSGLVAMIKDVVVVDDLTVRVTFDEPAPDFLMIATTAFDGIMDSKVVKEHGGTDAPDAAETDTATEWLDQNSASSGPFVLTSWVPNNEVVLEANPNYWRGRAYFDRIVFKHVPDKVAGFQQVQQGDVDILLRPNSDQLEQAEADPSMRVVIPAAMNIEYMALTCDPELSVPLSDQRVRQAINLALDRDGIIEAILAGHGTSTPSILPIGMPGVDPEKVLPRGLEKARTLLQEAGYPDGFTEKFYYSTMGTNDVAAAKIQADLAEIGITVELMPMDASQLSSRVWGDHDVPWVMDYWIPDYIGYTIWTDWFGFGDFHAANMRCEVPQELWDATKTIATEVDPEKRLQAVEEWQALMTDFAYAFNVYQYYETFLVRQDLQGFEFVPGGLFDSWLLHR